MQYVDANIGFFDVDILLFKKKSKSESLENQNAFI
jgi:hypothetical protein